MTVENRGQWRLDRFRNVTVPCRSELRARDRPGGGEPRRAPDLLLNVAQIDVAQTSATGNWLPVVTSMRAIGLFDER